MTIKITDDFLGSLIEQAEQQREKNVQPEFANQMTITKPFGKGVCQIFYLRGGLIIEIFNGQFWRPIIHERQHEETFPITAKFCLSGGVRVKTDNIPEITADYEETAGHNYLYHLPNLLESEEFPSDIPIQTLMIYADAHYFQALSPTSNELPRPLQTLMKADKRFHQPLGKITPHMNQVIQQILHCPYQSAATQQLYLESKALELLALQFDCLEADTSAPRPSRLNAADLERVKCARDILVDRLRNPPSLMELAHLCRLNDFKLKQGFHQLFGISVFGYLYDYRMQHAQSLLRDDRLSVAAISARVGYGSPEAFSTAFRRKFAISPKAYQLGQRGNV